MRRFFLVTGLFLAALLLLILLPRVLERNWETPDVARRATEDPDRTRLIALLEAETDLGKLRKLHDRFLAEGESDWAEVSVARILSIDPQDDWANVRAGNADLRKIYAEIPPLPDLELYPNPAWRRLVAFRDAGIHWGDEEDREELAGLLREVREHAIRLRSDPLYREEWRWRTWMRFHPGLEGLKTVVEYRPPYLVFVQVGRDEDRARQVLTRTSDLLQRLYSEFRRLFAERFDLPDLPELESGMLRIARVVVFADRHSYQTYLETFCNELSAWNLGIYRLDDQCLVLYDGRADDPEDGDAGMDAQKVLFTGVQQLLHFYRKIRMDRATGEDIPWQASRLRSDSPWFELGFARFLASARIGEKSEWQLMVENPGLLRQWREDESSHRGEALLPRLIELHHGDLKPSWKLAYPSTDRVFEASLRGWAFCYFLWYGADGSYREALIDYLGKELSGRSGPAVFTRCLWGDREPDWPGLEREWRKYMNDLAANVLDD